MRWTLALLVLAAGGSLVSGTVRAKLVDVAREIDRRWLNETIMDCLSRWHGDEDWSTAKPLAANLDYSWLQTPRPLRIGHALGASGTTRANRLDAVDLADKDGLRVLEIDLRLVADRLLCAHDEGDLREALETGCDLARVLSILPPKSWLVLDVKTDFDPASAAIGAVLRRTGKSKQVIFQLYRPEQLQRFNVLRKEFPELPGPILTAYLSHRRVADLAARAPSLNVRALAVPIERLPALGRVPTYVRVLVHPVHDCEAWGVAERVKAAGVYTLTGLHCSS